MKNLPVWIHPQNMRAFPNVKVTNSKGNEFSTNAMVLSIFCPIYSGVLEELANTEEDIVVILPDLAEKSFTNFEKLLHEGNISVYGDLEDARSCGKVFLNDLGYLILPQPYSLQLVCGQNFFGTLDLCVNDQYCEKEVTCNGSKSVLLSMNHSSCHKSTQVNMSTKGSYREKIELTHRDGDKVLNHLEALTMLKENKWNASDTAKLIMKKLDVRSAEPKRLEVCLTSHLIRCKKKSTIKNKSQSQKILFEKDPFYREIAYSKLELESRYPLETEENTVLDPDKAEAMNNHIKILARDEDTNLQKHADGLQTQKRGENVSRSLLDFSGKMFDQSLTTDDAKKGPKEDKSELLEIIMEEG